MSKVKITLPLSDMNLTVRIAQYGEKSNIWQADVWVISSTFESENSDTALKQAVSLMIECTEKVLADLKVLDN
jgi:hypothetical protein